jgi:hypothetical protein
VRRVLVLLLATFVAFGATAASAAWAPGGGGSGTSAGVTLGVPSSVGAAATSSTAVHITWAAPSSGPTPSQYMVRRTSPTTATVCTVSSPTVTCDDTGLTASTTYQYTVQSFLGTNWSSSQSGAASATTPSGPTLKVALAPTGTKTAGTAFNVTLTATTNGTTTNTAYTGSKTITFSGPSNAPDGTAPTYPASVTFASGVGTASITLRAAETATLDATDGTISGSTSVTVQAGAASQLGYTDTSVSCASGTANVGNGGTFTFKVTAFDAYMNEKTGARTINLSRTPTAGTTLSRTSLAIAAGNSETTSSGSLKIPVGNPSIALRAASSGMTTETCTVKK